MLCTMLKRVRQRDCCNAVGLASFSLRSLVESELLHEKPETHCATDHNGLSSSARELDLRTYLTLSRALTRKADYKNELDDAAFPHHREVLHPIERSYSLVFK